MDLMGQLVALALAGVLVVAAGAKLRHPRDTATELAAIGLRWPRVLTWAVPAAEVATAVALVVAPAWGGIAAFALLVGFTTVLMRLVRAGRPVVCRCFGAYSTKPVSRMTLVRNGVLLAMAAIAAAAPG
jgi:hypothetical protein